MMDEWLAAEETGEAVLPLPLLPVAARRNRGAVAGQQGNQSRRW